MEIKDLKISSTSIISEAISKINKTGLGIVFIEADNKITGSLTDGDIRRALLKGLNLNSLVDECSNKKPIILSIDSNKKTILSKLSNSIKIIPLVDDTGAMVDFASIKRLHNYMIMEPFLNGNEINYVNECISTNWISSQGKFVLRFEEEIKNLCNANFCLATSNGTTALHLALEALDIGKNDEVIVPNFTFGASVNSIVHAGATPVLVDVDKDSWNISLEAIKGAVTPKTKAIMPVHIYGNPCNMPSIMAFAKSKNLLVIEDCAEALGAKIGDKYVGSFGDAATFSFFANKVLTTGEGGALLIKNNDIYEKASILRDHGMRKDKRYWHDYVGFNYRLTNIQAAIGCAQLEQLNDFQSKRDAIWKNYNEHLIETDYFEFQEVTKNSIDCKWLYTILLRNDLNFSRDELLKKLKNFGIESRPVFFPMDKMPAFKEIAIFRSNPISENISERGLSLPSSITLNKDEISFICSSLISIIESRLDN